jgi:hypothetical protein
MNDTSTSAIASFTLNEAPVFVDVINMNKKGSGGNLLVSAVTNKGQLLLFTHELTDGPSGGSKLKKPIKPVNQLKVETKDNAAPLKIYGMFVANAQHERVDSLDLGNESSGDLSQLLANYSLYIVYGSHLNPKIEKLQFSDLNESKVTLKRDDPFKTSVTLQTQATKVRSILFICRSKLDDPLFYEKKNSIDRDAKCFQRAQSARAGLFSATGQQSVEQQAQVHRARSDDSRRATERARH